MAQKYARGNRAWGICGRSGKKMLLRDMVFDGRFPNMRVDPEWYEDKHPQEYMPKVEDPTALYRPSPEVIAGPTAPVLTAQVIGGSTTSTLTLIIGQALSGGVFDTAGPGNVPLTGHPSMGDFAPGTPPGSVVSGDTTNTLLTLSIYNVATVVLALCVVGTFGSGDLVSLSFIGSDNTQYNLTPAGGTFQNKTDGADPSLRYSMWQWSNLVPLAALVQGQQITFTITADFVI